MEHLIELTQEQAYTARVQQLLLALIERAQVIASDHLQSIQAIVADAWEDLRVKPTALSEEDLEQLSTEVDRFVVRRQFADSMAERSRRMLMKPFFARVDFIEQGEDRVEKIVIGLYSLKDEKGELLVHDWRAPVCSLYYDATPGEAKYQSPSGEIWGRLTLKRQYRMEEGRLKYYVDTTLNIDDAMLLDILSGATSRHMRQIVATIQSEQNAAIRQETARVVSVVGGAGSGKTSVAMHRAAYLMYRRRDVLDASKIMILSPSKAFSDYISDVIPELGEEPVREYSFYELAMDALDDVIDFEDPGDPLDIEDPGYQARARFKSDSAFLTRLDEYLRVLPERAFRAKDYHYDGSTVDAGWITGQFRFYQYDPILERLPTLADEVLEEYRYRGGLHKSREKRGAVLNKLKSMLVIRSPQALYRDFYKWLGRPEMLKIRDNRLEWPDVFPFLYLWNGYRGLPRHRSIRHLVVDEMQDYTPVQYAVLNIMYPCNKTILGDYGQCLNPWNGSGLPDLLACYPEAQFVELRKSYRSTAEIMNFAMKFNPDARLEVIDRHGKAPEQRHFESEADELRFVLSRVRDFRKGPRSSLAVILKSGAAASRYYEKLRESCGDGEELLLLSPETKKFQNGVIITSVQMAKGLEFDEVIVPKADSYDLSGFERNLLYIACTRAMHELTLA